MEIKSVMTKKNSVTFMTSDGKSYTVDRTHRRYPMVVDAISMNDAEAAVENASKSERLANKGQGDVEVLDGQVLYRGSELPPVLSERLVEILDDGFSIDFFAKFIDNLKENPSYTSVNELLLFLEHNDLAITPDGHFLAYKAVTNDFKDKYTRTFDNSPGATPKMARNEVNDDRTQTCSEGFHFCSYDYIKEFFGQNGDVIVIVKINPRDVVSIPEDYDNKKGRCCGYEVVEVYSEKGTKKSEKPKRVKSVETPDNWITGTKEKILKELGINWDKLRKRLSRGSSARWVDKDNEVITAKKD